MRSLLLVVGLHPTLIWLSGLVSLPTILFLILISPFLWVFIDLIADE